MITIEESRKTATKHAKRDWYKPGPSITQFHNSRALIRVLLGGRGSGKTTAIAVEAALKHGWFIAGARVYILRKTEKANADTTGETFDQIFGMSGTAYRDTGDSLFKKIEGGRMYRIPSRMAFEEFKKFKQTNPNKAQVQAWLETTGNSLCSFILFSGVPTTSHRASRFRGFECSMLIFVEADQFDKDDVDMAVNCLRWKSPDPDVCDDRGYVKEMSMILDSNPPAPSHWIAKWEEAVAEEEAQDGMEVRFWHIHTEENASNLPPNYVNILKRTYSKNPAMYARMVEGKYADAFDGDPVLWAFNQEHVFSGLEFPIGAYLVRGWDFGTTNCVIWSAYWEENGIEYWWDLYEHFAIMSDTERQCRSVQDVTSTVFPYHNDRSICAGILDFCDPAGDARKDTGRSLSVLSTYKFFPGFRRAGLQESIALYNRLLEKRDQFGRHVYRIDKDTCPKLYQASVGGYRYPSTGEPGFGSDEPLKGEPGGNYDHPADASRYAKFNALKLLQAEMGADSVELTGKLANDSFRKLTRARRYY